jgi:hypothetical protein
MHGGPGSFARAYPHATIRIAAVAGCALMLCAGAVRAQTSSPLMIPESLRATLRSPEECAERARASVGHGAARWASCTYHELDTSYVVGYTGKGKLVYVARTWVVPRAAGDSVIRLLSASIDSTHAGGKSCAHSELDHLPVARMWPAPPDIAVLTIDSATFAVPSRYYAPSKVAYIGVFDMLSGAPKCK